ncbi:MAG TPA: alcohol dehydrogenase catalytic domain-containing protein [Planctomycetota bacterium]|nr:alcohol dehydrogenase catalytic domain-containing protein [Planctomycetota bacterium]
MIPQRQLAVQLTGPDRLTLNRDKPVPRPGPTQILGRVECVGLCFSDMKLLHQFDQHPRKTPVLAHLARTVLADIPSYVPESQPTVPGHEVVLRVIEVGKDVTSVRAGGRYLVQADFRDLKTHDSNGAFGYNFEGGLQQYVLLDERVTVAANGDSYLMPVPDDRSASQLALVEPWSCVEDAFRVRERRGLKPGGTLLIAGGGTAELGPIDTLTSRVRLRIGAPVGGDALIGFTATEAATVAPQSVDDLLYAGADPAELEALMPLVAKGGLVLIAACGGRFGRRVDLPIGRVHYGNVRFAATAGARFIDALATIPASGELRGGDHVNIVGAGGPMGVMAMVRAVASSASGALVEGGVRNPERAQALTERVRPFAEARGVRIRLFNPETERPEGAVGYCFLMAPVPALVQQAIADAAERGIINVFAGIPADAPCSIDLDAVAAKRLYFIGTSGSTLDDYRVVLGKVVGGTLDTNLSVGAIAGMGGAIDGLNAVKARTIAGKIVVYPALGEFPLMELDALAQRYPSVGAMLSAGCWTKAAEDELLRVVAQAQPAAP